MGGVSLLGRADRMIESAYWLDRASPLTALVRPVGVGLTALGVVLAATAWRRHALAFVTALGVGSVVTIPIIVRAHVLAEPLFSWKPVAQAIEERLPEGIEVAFEAKEEYQLVGGLAYYLGRHVTLLELPGFFPPTYLESHFRSMFLPRERFLERWHAGEPTAVVSDPEVRRDTSDGIVPAPYHVVARFGDRWLLSNVAPWACAEPPLRVVATGDAASSTDGRLVAGSHAR